MLALESFWVNTSILVQPPSLIALAIQEPGKRRQPCAMSPLAGRNLKQINRHVAHPFISYGPSGITGWAYKRPVTATDTLFVSEHVRM